MQLPITLVQLLGAHVYERDDRIEPHSPGQIVLCRTCGAPGLADHTRTRRPRKWYADAAMPVNLYADPPLGE